MPYLTKTKTAQGHGYSLGARPFGFIHAGLTTRTTVAPMRVGTTAGGVFAFVWTPKQVAKLGDAFMQGPDDVVGTLATAEAMLEARAALS
jgi:hypothetical protein